MGRESQSMTGRGDMDVERSPLRAVIRAEAGPPPRPKCCGGVAVFLDPSQHKWYCENHPRHGDPNWLDRYQ